MLDTNCHMTSKLLKCYLLSFFVVVFFVLFFCVKMSTFCQIYAT